MPDTPTPTVFVVDDEETIALTLAAILNQSGFRASPFTSPEKALKAAESEAPALLISDVVMPEMNGIDLAIRFRSSHPQCKILLFSGQSATTDLLNSASMLGHEFQILAKPVHPKDLLAAIREL